MLESHYRINQAVGISINLTSKEGMLINACSVSVKDNKLDIEKKVIDLKGVEDLKKHFPEKSFIAVNFSGKGVLQKQLDKIDALNQNNFHQVLPNVNYDDFYVQNFISGEKSFVSVIRKTEADRWIDLLKKQGFIPLMLSLGSFPIQNIANQLNVYDSEIIFDGHTIQRNEQQEWINHTYSADTSSSFPLKIESEAINEKLIVSYAIAFQLVLANQLNLIKADAKAIDEAFDYSVSNIKLKVKGFVILIIFFLLLLINFFLFSWLNSSNAKLVDKVSVSTQSTNDIQGINEEVQNKEALLKQLGWDGRINKSVLIDQLAALLPPDVSWSEISINPIDKSSSPGEKTVRYMDGKIRVVGSSERIIPVNEWIARIKTKKWVKNVQLDSYTYNSELNTGQYIVIISY